LCRPPRALSANWRVAPPNAIAAGSLGFADPGLGPSDPDRPGSLPSFPPPPHGSQHPPANWPPWPLPPRPAGRPPPDPQGPGDAPPAPARQGVRRSRGGVPASAAAEPAAVPSRSPCSGLRRHACTPRAHCLPCIPLRLSSRIPRRGRPGSPLHILTDHIHRAEIGPNLHFPKTR